MWRTELYLTSSCNCVLTDEKKTDKIQSNKLGSKIHSETEQMKWSKNKANVQRTKCIALFLTFENFAITMQLFIFSTLISFFLLCIHSFNFRIEYITFACECVCVCVFCFVCNETNGSQFLIFYLEREKTNSIVIFKSLHSSWFSWASFQMRTLCTHRVGSVILSFVWVEITNEKKTRRIKIKHRQQQPQQQKR